MASQTLTEAEIAQIAEGARTATWSHSNLGRVARVDVGGVTYRVVFDGKHLPLVDMRSAWGNVEYVHGSFTNEQYQALGL